MPAPGTPGAPATAPGAAGPGQLYIAYTPRETGLLNNISGVFNSAVNTVTGLAGAAGSVISLLGGIFGGVLGGLGGGLGGGFGGGGGGGGGYNAVP